MNLSTTNPPALTQVAFPYAAESPIVAQQAYEPDDVHFALGLGFQTQSQGGHFTSGPSQMPHSFDPSIAFRSHQNHSIESPSNVQTTPVDSMGPPTRPRKRKAPTLRADAWEPYKARIVELYISLGLSLPEVKKKIEDEFGFTAEYVKIFMIEQLDFKYTNIIIDYANTEGVLVNGERIRTLSRRR